jgi:RimJ/RimL family protein N-acetyltransferase
MNTNRSSASIGTLPNAGDHLIAPVRVEAGHPLHGDRITLRLLRENDRAEYVRVLTLSRESLQPALGLWHHAETSAEVFTRHLRLAWEGEETGRSLRRIAVLPSGQIAGAFNLISISRGLDFEGQMNWWVSKDQQGRGLGKEGACLLADYALRDLPLGLGLTRLRASIMPDHARSRRIALAAGFLSTGERETVLVDGRWLWHERWARVPQTH